MEAAAGAQEGGLCSPGGGGAVWGRWEGELAWGLQGDTALGKGGFLLYENTCQW